MLLLAIDTERSEFTETSDNFFDALMFTCKVVVTIIVTKSNLVP